MFTLFQIVSHYAQLYHRDFVLTCLRSNLWGSQYKTRIRQKKKPKQTKFQRGKNKGGNTYRPWKHICTLRNFTKTKSETIIHNEKTCTFKNKCPDKALREKKKTSKFIIEFILCWPYSAGAWECGFISSETLLE